MNEDKEEWIEGVFDSLKGSERAVPKAELFAKIKQEITSSEAKVVSIRQWRMTAAAAILLLLTNTYIIQQFSQNNLPTAQEKLSEDGYQSTLLSNYEIYE